MSPQAHDAVDAIIGQWHAVRPELDTVPMAVLGRIFRIADAAGVRMEQTYAAFGISRGEFDVLATLRRSGAPYVLPPRQLSSTLMITTGGITGRLDKLEAAGLLARSPDPDDRRGVRVTLTDDGRRIVDNAVVAGLDVQREILDSALSSAQTSRLDELLRLVVRAAARP